MMRIEEAADARHHLDLARLGHARQAAGELLDHAVLEAAQLVEVDLAAAPNLMPWSGRCLTSSITEAVCSSAFDGMQPTFRHTPPSVA